MEKGLRGLLAVSAFLKGEGFEETYVSLEEAFAARGLELVRETTAVLAGTRVFPSGIDFVLMWDKDVLLSRRLENAGIRVFNTSRAAALCDDKRLTYLALEGSGLSLPRTYIPPVAYDPSDYLTPAFGKLLETAMDYPCVMKQAKGSFGEQVCIVSGPRAVQDTVRHCGTKDFLLQEIVKTSIGRDCRIYVAGGRAVASVLREGRNGDFRSNLASGGTVSAWDAPPGYLEAAERAAGIMGLDFCGADVLFGADGPVICEINGSAQFRGLRAATGVNPADHIAARVLSVCGKNIDNPRSRI